MGGARGSLLQCKAPGVEVGAEIIHFDQAGIELGTSGRVWGVQWGGTAPPPWFLGLRPGAPLVPFKGVAALQQLSPTTPRPSCRLAGRAIGAKEHPHAPQQQPHPMGTQPPWLYTCACACAPTPREPARAAGHGAVVVGVCVGGKFLTSGFGLSAPKDTALISRFP